MGWLFQKPFIHPLPSLNSDDVPLVPSHCWSYCLPVEYLANMTSLCKVGFLVHLLKLFPARRVYALRSEVTYDCCSKAAIIL